MHSQSWRSADSIPCYQRNELIEWGGRVGRVLMRGNNSGEVLVRWDAEGSEPQQDEWTTDDVLHISRKVRPL